MYVSGYIADGATCCSHIADAATWCRPHPEHPVCPVEAGLARLHLSLCCTLGSCVLLRWPCRGKPGLAAGWLTTVTGPALMMELDAMDHADLTAALNAMRPRQAAEMLEVSLCWGLLNIHKRSTLLPIVWSRSKIIVVQPCVWRQFCLQHSPDALAGRPSTCWPAALLLYRQHSQLQGREARCALPGKHPSSNAGCPAVHRRSCI